MGVDEDEHDLTDTSARQGGQETKNEPASLAITVERDESYRTLLSALSLASAEAGAV